MLTFRVGVKAFIMSWSTHLGALGNYSKGISTFCGLQA